MKVFIYQVVVLMDPPQRIRLDCLVVGLKLWLLQCSMKNKSSRNHRCEHNDKQCIFSTNAKQRLPVSI